MLEKKMILTLEDIRKLCTESSFERGIEYFKMGRVINLKQLGDKITATVEGTDDYQVTIYTEKNIISATCTCPYDWGGYCKHIVAALIALSENYPKTTSNTTKEEERTEDILSNLSLDELKVFLRTEFEENPSLKEHFTIYFSGKGIRKRSLFDYKKEINQLYCEVSDRSGFIKYGTEVEFYSIHNLADWFSKAGNNLEAVTIYQALSEVIAENMGNVDDSDGYYGDEFVRAIEDMASCINKAELNHKEKKEYIKYFFTKYIESDPDYFSEYYGYALKEICYLKDDLHYWRKLLQPHLPEKVPDSSRWSEYYQAIEYLKMQLHILDLLNDREEFYHLIQRYYHRNHELCLYYICRLEKDGKNKEAVKVAEEGLNIFPPHLTGEIRRFLNKFYKKHSPEKYKQNLINLFIQNREWSDYEKLKEICTEEEWKEKIITIITNGLLKERIIGGTIIELYLKEEMFEQALKHVIAQKSLFTLSLYHKYLAKKFPAIYFNAYQELIPPFADSRTGRPHYREIVKYLKQMKKIEGFAEEFNKLINLLKTKYANRPAFLDEMKAI